MSSEWHLAQIISSNVPFEQSDPNLIQVLTNTRQVLTTQSPDGRITWLGTCWLTMPKGKRASAANGQVDSTNRGGKKRQTAQSVLRDYLPQKYSPGLVAAVVAIGAFLHVHLLSWNTCIDFPAV